MSGQRMGEPGRDGYGAGRGPGPGVGGAGRERPGADPVGGYAGGGCRGDRGRVVSDDINSEIREILRTVDGCRAAVTEAEDGLKAAREALAYALAKLDGLREAATYRTNLARIRRGGDRD